MATQELKAKFDTFVQHGAGSKGSSGELDGTKFAKLCQDTGLVSKGSLTPTDVDLIFSKAKDKGARKISFVSFQKALTLIAEKKGVDVAEVEQKIIGSDGPKTNATVAEPVRFHDDKSTYGSGIHAHGGPSTVDQPKDLSGLTDRSAADVRGVKV